MSSATAELWELKDRLVPAVAGAVALTGLPMLTMRDAARVSLAASPEVAALLERLPDRIRTLPMTLEDTLERCVHSVRGPVVWSETITARANALGNEDVFVCTTARRSFQHPANRALVAVLAEVAAASKALSGPVGALLEPADRRRLDDIAVSARQWRHHRRLADLSPITLRLRDISRLRKGRHRDTVQVILDAYHRMHDPFVAEDLEGLSDSSTRSMHEFVLECLRAAGNWLPSPPTLLLDGGALRCGPIAFRHPRAPGAAAPGLSVGDRMISPGSPVTSGNWPEGGLPVGSAVEVGALAKSFRQ